MGRRPLLWVAMAFAGGVLLADSFAAALPFFAFALPVCLLAFGLTKRRFWLGAAFLLLAALLGGLRYRQAQPTAPNDIARFAPAFTRIIGRVASDAEFSGPQNEDGKRRARFVLAAQSLERETKFGFPRQPVSGFLQVSLPLAAPSDSTAPFSDPLPRYGEILTLTGRMDLPEGARNPGGFDARAFLERKGIHATLTVRRAQDGQVLRVVEPNANPLALLAFRLRRGILQSGRDALPPERAAVLNGILLGARSELPAELRDAFERTGTSHVLATAGLHIGIFVWLFFGLLRLLSVGRRPATAACLAALLVFALMAGGRPSVMRAGLVAGLFLAGFLLEREPDWWTVTGFAALILLLQNPLNLFDAGFQMSFVTVITLVLLLPFFARFLAKFRQDFRDPLPVRARKFVLEYFVGCFVLALAAQIAVAPLLAYYQSEISPVGVFANATAVPLIAPIFAFGFAAVWLGAVNPAFASPLYFALNHLLEWLVGLVRGWDGLPFAALSFPAPPRLVVVAVVWGFVVEFMARVYRGSRRNEFLRCIA